MKISISKFINQYGLKGIASILLYHFFITFIIIKNQIYTIYESIKGFDGFNGYYSGTSLKNSYNNYFYKNQYETIKKDCSSYLFFGKVSAKDLFWLSKWALFFQHRFGGAMIQIVSAIIFVSTMSLYEDSENLYLVVIIALTSTIFYANYFDVQNYNLLGWSLIPLLLYCYHGSNVVVFALLMVVLSRLSVSAVLATIFLFSSYALMSYDFQHLLALLLGGIISFAPIVKTTMTGMIGVLKTIGATKKNVVFIREDLGIDVRKIYFIVLYIMYSVAYLILNQDSDFEIHILFSVLAIAVVNWHFVRFLDYRNVYLLVFLVATVATLNSSSDVILLFYFLLVNPIYGLMYDVLTKDGSFVDPGKRKMINTADMEKDLIRKISKLKEESQVTITYKDPECNYSELFDRSRRVYQEVIQYACIKNNLFLFPDWYSVMNGEYGAVEGPKDLLDSKYKFDYLIVTPPFASNKWSNKFDKVVDFHLLSIDGIKEKYSIYKV